MMEATRQRQVNGQRKDFYLAIDATKFLQVIDILTACRSIMGGVYPNHILITSDMNKYEIKDILDKK